MQGSDFEQFQQQFHSAHVETRKQAVQQLSELKDERAIEVLIDALTRGERDVSVWYAVAQALVSSGDPRAVPALVEALQHHEDDFVRAGAAAMLGEVAGAQAGEVLVKALQEDRGGGGVVRAAAAGTLGKIGDPRAVPALCAALAGHDKFEVLCTVAEALGMIGGAQATQSLGSVLGGTSEGIVQRTAARSLGKIGDARAVEQLVEALKSPDREVRRTAAEVLESLGWRPGDDIQRVLRAMAFEQWQEVVSLGVAAIEPLIGLLQHGRREIGKATARALVNEADPWTVESLVRTLNGEEGVVKSAAQALGDIGDPQAVEPLAEMLKEATATAQQIAACALGIIGGLEGIEPLLEALRAWEVQQARWRARSTLPLGESGDDGEDDAERSVTQEPPRGENGDARALEPLVRALNDVENVVRAIALALGTIGDPRAGEPLIAALARNEQWEALQRAVAEAHEKMGDAQTTLVAILETNGEQEALREAAVAWALGRTREARAIEPLVRALQDKDERVQQAAAVALGMIGGAQAIGALEGALKKVTASDQARSDVWRQLAWSLMEAQRTPGGGESFARLLIEAGQQQGHIYQLRDPVIRIGRSQDNDIVLVDRLVARRHARLIRLEDGTYGIENLHWPTGIMLNGRGLNASEIRPLQNGDRLHIGQTVFVYGFTSEERRLGERG